MCVGRSHDVISLQSGVGNLGNNILVGEADDEAVLRGVVEVLLLGDEALACVVVGLSS